MLDILQSTIEELDAIPQPLLDAILENLVMPAKMAKPTAYGLARSVLSRCANFLAEPLKAFMQSCLPTSSSVVVESDLREEWPHLFVELTSVSTDFVDHLLPQLVVSTPDLVHFRLGQSVRRSPLRAHRLLVIGCACSGCHGNGRRTHAPQRCPARRLLTSPAHLRTTPPPSRLSHGNYPGPGASVIVQLFLLPCNVSREFPQLLPALVAKFNDVSAQVRVAMVQHGVQLVTQQQSHAQIQSLLLAALKVGRHGLPRPLPFACIRLFLMDS